MLVLLLVFTFLVNALNVNVPANPANAVGPIPPFFSALAVEYFGIKDLFLTAPFLPPPPVSQRLTEIPKRLNLAVLQLIRNLATLTQSDPPAVMRIGGNSAQRMWIRGSTLPRMPNQIDEVSDYEFQLLDAVANYTGVKYIIQVGMPTPTPVYLGEVLDIIKRNIQRTHILAIEVGNEPDHFSKKGWRDASYTYQQYAQEYDVYVNYIKANYAPDVELMGPSYAYPWRDEGFQVPFIEQKANSTKWMAFHRYAMRGCSDSTTLGELLNSPLPGEYAWVSTLTQATQRTGTFNVWGEGGTASCRGVLGISDVFASGVWTVDMLFEMAFRGVHASFLAGAPQANYAPFTITDGVLDVRPTYYGMMLFNAALNGPNTVVFSPTATGTTNQLKAWGAYDAGQGIYTIVVLHKSTNPDEPVTLNIAGVNGVGQRIVLTAPSLEGVNQTIAGYQFDNSPDGLPLASTSYQETIVQGNGGTFTFTAPRGSVTLFKVYTRTTTPPQLLNFQQSPWMVEVIQQGGGPNRTTIRPGTGTARLPSSAVRLSYCFGLFGLLFSLL